MMRRNPPVQAGPEVASEDKLLRAEGLSEIAGYRVVRRLGSGSRADVYLGCPTSGGGGPAAVKVFRADADRESIEREIRALGSASAGCFMGLFDVATLADGRMCLILEKLDPRTLGRLLSDSVTLLPGEVVSVLAPVFASLAQLHELGLVHGSLGLGSILLHATGRPVLAGLGSLRDRPGVSSAQLALLRADGDRLAALIRTVFMHLDPKTSRAETAWAAGGLVDHLVDACRTSTGGPALRDMEFALFAWSDGAPLHFAYSEEPSQVPAIEPVSTAIRPYGRHRRAGGSAEEQVITGGSDLGEDEPRIGAPGYRPEAGHLDQPVCSDCGAARAGAGAGATMPVTPVPRVQSFSASDPGMRLGVPPANGFRSLWARATTVCQGLDASALQRVRVAMGASLRARRRPLALAALVAAAAAVLALTLLPPGGESTPDFAAAQTSVSALPTPAASTPSGSVPVRSAQAESDIVSGDDPVAAVTVLLAARTACLAAGSASCLTEVDQGGSAALTADTAQIQGRQQGQLGPVSLNRSASLIERTGNIALVQLEPSLEGTDSKPASVLVVKGEAGWRLREILSY